MLAISQEWRAAYPGAAVGILAMKDVRNPENNEALERQKVILEAELRVRFSGATREDLRSLPVIEAYSQYYKRFKKRYHVLLQLETVAIKGNPIPRVAALVEGMFMAEIKNLLLTAGHDLDAVAGTVKLDVSQGKERYVRINGQDQILKAGDMFIADGQGVISSIIYGPDRRTRITTDTQQVFFTIYAPPGIETALVHQHLNDIRGNVRLVAPNAQTVLLEVYHAA